jgi:hypothetical protein
VFGYLLLHQWAKQGQRVIVVKRGDCPTPTLLTADGAYELDRVALRVELDNPDVRYVAPFILCPNLLCSSGETGSCVGHECVHRGSPLPLNN